MSMPSSYDSHLSALQQLARPPGPARKDCCAPLVAGMGEREKEKRFWRRKVLCSLAFSVPVFLLAMVFGNVGGPVRRGLNTGVGGFTVNELVQWILTTPVQVCFPFLSSSAAVSLARQHPSRFAWREHGCGRLLLHTSWRGVGTPWVIFGGRHPVAVSRRCMCGTMKVYCQSVPDLLNPVH